jgi:hypothetical protein
MINLFNTKELSYKDIIGKQKIKYLRIINNEVFAFLNNRKIQISENGKVDMRWFNKSQRKFQKESEARTAEMCKTWKDRERACWYYEHKKETT